MKAFGLAGLLAAALFAAGASAQGTHFDDFEGSSLDAEKWMLVEGNVSLAAGQLRTSGAPDHKRIDSIRTFGDKATIAARMSLGGRFQKFGFRVNPTEFGTTGYYFDTFGDDGFGGDESVPNATHAVAWSGASQILVELVPVSWNAFHEFRISRDGGRVTFFIDDEEVAHVDDSFSGALPMGIWNDRAELMETDWVDATETPNYRLPFVGRYRITNGPGCGTGSKKHDGFEAEAIDYALPIGRNVLASESGTVICGDCARRAFPGHDLKGFGRYLVIGHADGSKSFYAHLSDVLVFSGEVSKGQTVALSGDTGKAKGAEHLHFQIQDRDDNPIPIRELEQTIWDPRSASNPCNPRPKTDDGVAIGPAP